MGRHYIPLAVAAFNDWQEQAIKKVKENQVPWGISGEAVNLIVALHEEWNAFYPSYADKKLRSSYIVEQKNVLMERYTSQMRSFFAEYILNNSKISDAERVSLGLSPRDKTPTSVVVPTTQPIAKIDFSVRLQHRVSFVDSATPTSRAKPHGIYGCQIWIKIGGDAPVSEDDLKFIGTETASPHLIKFNGSDAGKPAYYWLRWVNKRGETGPWSVPVSATIVG